jgi:hypothetical protein
MQVSDFAFSLDFDAIKMLSMFLKCFGECLDIFSVYPPRTVLV